MNIGSKILFALALFSPLSSAWASIPQSQTIAARVARGHGKNAYIIEQDIQFRTNAEPLVLRERWLIENGDRMRVTVTPSQTGGAKGAEPVRFEALYLDGRRTFTDLAASGAKAGIRSAAFSPEFIESAFHARTGKGFLTSLVRAHVIPQSLLSEKAPKITKLEQIKHIPETGVRLGRDAGVVTWIFGEPSPAEGPLNPQAWIEQDSFILKRLRFPTEAEVAADRVSTFPNGLKFPRERTVTWGENSVTIRVVAVHAASSSSLEKSFDPKNFALSVKPAHLPDLAQVRDFYSRFR